MELLSVVSLYSMSFKPVNVVAHTHLQTTSTCATIHGMRDEEAALMQAEYEASILCQSTLCPLSPTSRLSTCYTESMTVNRSQLITALYNEYKFLCHDDFDADVDATPDEYLAMLNTLSDDELFAESSTDEHFTLDEFISTWS
jgi:hypothetical protein